MPRAPKKCSVYECEVRGVGRYCPEHQIRWDPKRTHAKSGEHKVWRAAVLKRDKGHCQIGGPNCTHRATEADHIVNVAAGGAPFDVANGQSACSNCHSEKSKREAAIGRGFTPRK